MISSKLLVLLQSFSKHEMRAFSKFIQSPFHNENEDLENLFRIIHHEFRKSNFEINQNQGLKKEMVWKKIKGKEVYHDEQMRRICSDLTKKIYDFIAYQNYNANPQNKLIHLLNALHAPNLTKHFNGIIRQIQINQQKSSVKDAGFHLNNYLIEHSKYIQLENLNEKTKAFESLENADFNLDCFYISKKLKNYCDALGYENIFSENPQIQLLPDFLENLEDSRYLELNAIKAYYLVVYMFLEPHDETHFQSLKSLLKKCFTTFSKEELNTLYIYLKNYCIKNKINNGHSEFYFELFDIFKTSIEHEIIFNRNQIDPQDYKNIITVGLHIKEFDWTEDFIQNYTNRLPKESQDNDLNYNLAKVYFHKQEYHKVIEQLREVEYKNLSYTMGGRLMLLKTYYELKELNALESLLDSYRVYLMRNKLISREVKQQLMNGIRFTRKLASLAPYDTKGIQKLKEQINNCKALAAKKWLLEKVGEIE